MNYRKFPPDLDGFGWFVAALVVALLVIVIVRLT
jgi:hypothetical protein